MAEAAPLREAWWTMSVHAEYSRALETLLNRLRGLDEDVQERTTSGLEGARVGANPDLSTAARACLDVLADLDAALGISTAEPSRGGPAAVLREPFLHLEAHCRAILGLPS